MDGPHDLGGKPGFGPIPIGDGDAPFSYEWEKRVWAMARSGIAKGITIDWFRHGLERMVPHDYRSFRYFNKWCTNFLMLLIDNQTITLSEAVAGHSDRKPKRAVSSTLEDVMAANRAGHSSFATDSNRRPRFAIGDTVTTQAHISAAHNRLPSYASGKTGRIVASHGAHILPDTGALGQSIGEPLYTVAFRAGDLWDDAAHPHDTVMVELWESYFV